VSGSALRGTATGPGTRRGADSFGVGARTLGRTGLTVSPIGFGAARVRDDSALHTRALADALRGGVNLIDTSAHAVGGSGERLVGKMLANLVQHGEVRREQIVVVSRVGRSVGSETSSIDPASIRAQLDASLERLGLERLDVLLLHDPERSEGEDLDARLSLAFDELELMVQSGRIGWYGVSSGGFAEPPGSERALSLQHLLRLAESVGGAAHHFGVARMPLNLFELGAALPRGDAPSTMAVAAAADVGVLAHRSLDAFVEHGPAMIRLANVPEVGGDVAAADEVLGRVRKLEAEWATGLGQQLMVGPDENAVDLFRWGQELAPRLSAMTLEQWTHLRHEVVAPHLGRTSATLLEALEGEPRQAFASWWERYGTVLHEAFEAVEAALRSRRRDLAGRITDALGPVLPSPWQGLPLSNQAILTALSAPVSCVAVGMRQPGYVHDVLALREHPVRLLGASAGPVDFGALARAMATVELPRGASD
jgi:aryl-alcohol dehydrogenase-like predicted oxidoreductase